MSNSVFPSLTTTPGLAWSVLRAPSFLTKKQTSVGNVELAASFTPYPRWTWTLRYNVLRQATIQSVLYAEFETLAGFFLSRRGGYDSFLYDDPSDDSVSDMAFGTGDGSTTQFRLFRTLGGFAEPIYNVNAITNIKVAGVPTGAYSQSGGLITFSGAPANGAALTWTGSYYWRARFTQDESQFEEFASQFWRNQSVSFKSVLGS